MRRLWYGIFALVSSAEALWPRPRHFEQGTDVLRLSPEFHFELACPLLRQPPKDLLAAMEDALHLIETDRHRPLVVDRGESVRPLVERAHLLSSLSLSLGHGERCDEPVLVASSISEESRRPLEQRNERYCLEVTAESARLSADTTIGLFRGLQAFSQLVYTLPPGRQYAEDVRSAQMVMQKDVDLRYLHVPVRIADSPAFPYRGFLLDTSRNFYDVETLKKLLRAASFAAFNVFHWHVVDSHSWPMELPDMPDLAAKGRNDVSQSYSPAELADVTAYANARGIDIMLEIDMPGHTGSIGEAYPDYVACFHRQPWSQYAAEAGGTGQLRIADPHVVRFTEKLLRSVLRHSPSAYLSTGGDEINFQCYADDGATQTSLQARSIDIDEALQLFTDATHQVIRDAGKTPLVWEEIAIKQDVKLHPDTLVAIWTNSGQVLKAIQRGLRVILAPSDYFCECGPAHMGRFRETFTDLDCGLGGWLGQPRGEGHLNSWCDPFKSWHRMYSFDPFDKIPRSKRHLVQGGQVLLWSEQADANNVEQLFWPRAAAAAEVFWTGGQVGNERKYAEALPRLHDLRYRMVQRGVKAIPLQPHWCALRPGECDADSAR